MDGGAPLDATIAALPGTLRELRDGAPELTGLVDRLDRFSVPVGSALPDFTEAVGQATPLLRKSIPVLEDVTPIVADLRTISARLADSSPTLARLMQVMDPVTKTFGDSVLPVLLQDSRRGPPTYEQLLATFSAADAVFRPYQTAAQNPLGAGHAWNIGTYIDFTGPLAGAFGGGSTMDAEACEKLARARSRLRRRAARAGGCE